MIPAYTSSIPPHPRRDGPLGRLPIPLGRLLNGEQRLSRLLLRPGRIQAASSARYNFGQNYSRNKPQVPF